MLKKKIKKSKCKHDANSYKMLNNSLKYSNMDEHKTQNFNFGFYDFNLKRFGQNEMKYLDYLS